MLARSAYALSIACCLALCLGACQVDSYSTGEGRNSLTQATFASLTVDADKQGIAFLTDEGENYTLLHPYRTSWIETPDTVYRALIYYNKVDEGKADIRSSARLTTIHPIAHWRFTTLPQDPLDVQSVWLSNGARYLNLALLVKSGYVDDKEERQTIGMAVDTLLHHADGRTAAHYRLLHSQNDVPQYFTNRRYVTVALPATPPDTIHLTIPTYAGEVLRTLVSVTVR